MEMDLGATLSDISPHTPFYGWLFLLDSDKLCWLKKAKDVKEILIGVKIV